MNVAEYLQHIGIEDKVLPPTLETLNRLQVAHLSKVPFENLDMFGGERRQIDLINVYNKIVKENRGGICCELNGLYCWLLRQLGFDVEAIEGRPYIVDQDDFFGPMSHILMLVNLDGKTYTTDVAYGKHSCLRPLLLEEKLVQEQENGIYRFRRIDPTDQNVLYLEEKWLDSLDAEGKIVPVSETNPHYCASVHRTEGWNILYKLYIDKFYELEDFKSAFDFFQDQPDNFFRANNFASLRSEETVLNLHGNCLTQIDFKRCPDGLTQRRTKTQLDSDAINDVIRKRFGVEPPKAFVPKADGK
uniref:arylamine N-acetyltransferase n=1 Tax=Phallusia mammillata TaxID=59560 RepID=A0A6F9DMQ9_9ASCI|nr:arylamine N-acetyltransferase, pineal gland isozyme NAT-3 [Phallusia mammillata]